MLQDAVGVGRVHTSDGAIAIGGLHLPHGDRATARLHRDWLKTLPRLTGKTLTGLAKSIKVAPSTLTRPIREGDDGTSTLHATTIRKVVDATGVPPPGEIGLPASGRRPQRGFGEEAAPYSPASGDPISGALALLAEGRSGLAVWQLLTDAVELAGYLPGDLLLLDLNNLLPKPGDLVCAQVYDWPAMKAETVVRVFERASPVDLLVARSAVPRPPIVVDGERVALKGVFLPHRLRPAGA